MQGIKKAVNTVASSLFPSVCMSCGEIIDEGKYFCEICDKMTERVDFQKCCHKCGLEKDNCDCEKTFFHFDRCISPFYNRGTAQTALYKAKFLHKESYFKYFSEQIAIAVKNEYSDIAFDGICYVPMPLGKRLRRGFNQCKIMAEQVSQILGIPVLNNAIYCKRTSISQHKLGFTDRFNNIRGLYGWKYKNTGRTVLLIDDIKTTGATLDECTRQLMFSGAEHIYCASAIISPKKIRQENTNGD